MHYNWKPVVKSLLNTLKTQGFFLVGADDGEETFNTPDKDEIAEIVCSVDASSIYVEKNGKHWIFIVLGNDPEEIMADYSSNADLDRVLDLHVSKWSGKKCPIEN